MNIVKKELDRMSLKLVSSFTISNKMTAKSQPVVKYMNFAKELVTQKVQSYKIKYFK